MKQYKVHKEDLRKMTFNDMVTDGSLAELRDLNPNQKQGSKDSLSKNEYQLKHNLHKKKSLKAKIPLLPSKQSSAQHEFAQSSDLIKLSFAAQRNS